MALGWMLSALEEAEPGIKLQIQHGGVGQCRCVERELKNFTASAALDMQHAQPQRRGQSLPIGIDSDAGHRSAPVFRSGFQGLD